MDAQKKEGSAEAGDRRAGVVGGGFALVLGVASALVHGAALAFIMGWGEGPRSDAERLEAGLAALVFVPIVIGAIVSAIVAALGLSAIRDARGPRTGAAAGRLWMLFGAITILAAFALMRGAGSWMVLASIVVGALGAWLNFRAWRSRADADRSG